MKLVDKITKTRLNKVQTSFSHDNEIQVAVAFGTHMRTRIHTCTSTLSCKERSISTTH